MKNLFFNLSFGYSRGFFEFFRGHRTLLRSGARHGPGWCIAKDSRYVRLRNRAIRDQHIVYVCGCYVVLYSSFRSVASMDFKGETVMCSESINGRNFSFRTVYFYCYRRIWKYLFISSGVPAAKVLRVFRSLHRTARVSFYYYII